MYKLQGLLLQYYYTLSELILLQYAPYSGEEGESMMKPLQIGKHQVPYPLIQGGMGVRISGGSLAGHVAKCGGIGLVAAAGIAMNSPFFNGRNYMQAEPEAFKAELAKA